MEKNLIDIGIAFGIVYGILLIIVLTVDFSSMAIAEALFGLFLSLVFPFIAVFVEPIGLLFIALFGVAFALIFRYIPPAYIKYGLAVTLAGWVLYGMYCTVLVTGGA